MCKYDGSYVDLLVEHFGYIPEEAQRREQEAYDPVRRARVAEKVAQYEAQMAEWRRERLGA